MLIGAFVAVSGLTWTGEMGRAAMSAFILTRAGLLRGELWRLVTYAFISPPSIWFVFKLLVFVYIAAPLETMWGTRRFLTLFAVSVIGGGLTAVLFNQVLAGGWAVTMTLMLIHGFLFPESVIYVFFILPIRMRTLAVISTVVFLASCVTMGLRGLAYFAGMLCGVAYYVLVTRSIPWARKASRRITGASLNPASVAGNVTAGRTMARAREIIKAHKPGRLLSEEDRAFIEELVQRGDPGNELCSPYSFSPDNTICPPCAEFGRCLRRHLDQADQEAAEAQSLQKEGSVE